MVAANWQFERKGIIGLCLDSRSWSMVKSVRFTKKVLIFTEKSLWNPDSSKDFPDMWNN